MRTAFIGACIVVVFASFLHAFSVGTKKDLMTGLSTKNSGLGFDDTVLTANGEKMSSSGAPLGSKIVLLYTGVNGFTEVKGKVYPGLYMSVADLKGNNIAEFKDLFSNYSDTGMDPDTASNMKATLNTGSPMQKNKEYRWKVRIWDKKGKGEIISEMKLKMK